MSYQKFFYNLLPHRMKRQMRELFASTVLVNIALAMVMIFEPIYLYQIGYSLQKIVLFYLVVYILYIILLPLGAKFARRKGYELGIFLGTTLFMLYYLFLFFIFYYPILFYIAPILFAIQKMFYWPAYHADFARFSDDQEEGREVSTITILTSLAFILGPALAGLIINFWGYGALFVVVSLIFLLSNVPILITKEKVVRKKFPYLETYKNLFSQRNRRVFFSYIGFGEEFIILTIWPIFISLIILNLFDLGLIITLATLVTVAITLYIGRISDYQNRRKILGWGASFYSLSCFFRIFVATQLAVFFIDAMSRLARNIIGIPLMAITYEDARNRDVMKQVVFFEMSLVIGKIVAMLIIYFGLFFITDQIFAFKLTFILAGAMSLLYLLL